MTYITHCKNPDEEKVNEGGEENVNVAREYEDSDLEENKNLFEILENEQNLDVFLEEAEDEDLSLYDLKNAS